LGFDISSDEYKIVINGKNTKYNISNEIYYSIIMDPIEIISYIICTVINLPENTISPYTIKNVNTKHLGEAYNILQTIGIELIETNEIECYYIKKNILKPFAITTGYFPEIYTDIQPFFCILALFINGICKINETIWDNRFNYVKELNKLGYNIEICNDLSTIIIDSSKKGDININMDINCTDLRGGMALYMLLKTKYNFINFTNKQIIDRGYYNYENNIKTIINSSIIIKTNYITTPLSNIKIGGYTKYYSEFENIEDLILLRKFSKKINTKNKIIGGGYNVYFNDYFDGLILLNKIKYINNINNNNNIYLTVSSGMDLMDLIYYCCNNNVDISELSGIPGTVGGSVYGNAGAYGMEISNFIDKCHILNSENNIIELSKDEMQFTYRNSILKNNKLNYIIISVDFIFKKNITSENITNKIQSILDIRNKKFIYKNTLGSIFKNIILCDKKIYAWEMIDLLNLRGKIINNLLLTENHPNIFININNALPKDITNLINDIIYDVEKNYNMALELEIEFI